MKRLLPLVAASAALALVPAAQAGPIVDEAVAALQSSPVYVDPGAELAISSADQNELREKIDTAGAGPVYIAILPAAAELGGRRQSRRRPSGAPRRARTQGNVRGRDRKPLSRGKRRPGERSCRPPCHRGTRRPPRPGRDGDAAGLHRPRGDGAFRRDEWWRRRRRRRPGRRRKHPDRAARRRRRHLPRLPRRTETTTKPGRARGGQGRGARRPDRPRRRRAEARATSRIESGGKSRVRAGARFLRARRPARTIARPDRDSSKR